MVDDPTAQDTPDAVARVGRHLEELNLITRTFAALSLYSTDAICDTLLSLAASFLDTTLGLIVRPEEDAVEFPAVRGDWPVAALNNPPSEALWRSLLGGSDAQIVSRSQVAEALGGFEVDQLAVATLDLEDRPVALLVLGGKRLGSFTRTDLSMLTAMAGIGALALASGAAVTRQQHYAEEAARETAEKERVAQVLDAKLDVIERQHHEILELSTPVLELWRHVLVVPIIGALDAARTGEMMERLLASIVDMQARYVLLDLTGATMVDSHTADQLGRVVAAAQLLGATALLTGIRPELAQTLAGVGIRLDGIKTSRTLRAGLRACLDEMKRSAGDPTRAKPTDNPSPPGASTTATAAESTNQR